MFNLFKKMVKTELEHIREISEKINILSAEVINAEKHLSTLSKEKDGKKHTAAEHNLDTIKKRITELSAEKSSLIIKL